MKRFIILGATMAAVGLAIGPVNAQTQSTTTSSTTTEYLPSSKIIGSKIRSSDGSEVGVIKDVVLDKQTGCMAYTVLETSGGGDNVAGGGTTSGSSRSTTTTTTSRRTVAMPW